MNNKNYIQIIIALGFIVYSNSLFNGFAFDDLWQIQNNTKVHSLSSIPSIFIGSTFGYVNPGDQPTNLFYYYKPFMTLGFNLIYAISGATPFSFHFVQILMHILVSILIFKLFSRYFQKKLSLFLSLVFLVHPINTETVDYIAAFQDVLFTFFGLICLYYFIRKTEFEVKFKKTYYLLIYALLFSSMLSKESGILFLALLPLYSIIFVRKKIIPIIPISFLTLLSYLYLRFAIGNVGFNPVRFIPIAEANLLTRIINIPKMFFYYLSTLFFPKDIFFQPMWLIKNITFKDFYLPLTIDLVFIAAILMLGFITWKKM